MQELPSGSGISDQKTEVTLIFDGMDTTLLIDLGIGHLNEADEARGPGIVEDEVVQQIVQDHQIAASEIDKVLRDRETSLRDHYRFDLEAMERKRIVEE